MVNELWWRTSPCELLWPWSLWRSKSSRRPLVITSKRLRDNRPSDPRTFDVSSRSPMRSIIFDFRSSSSEAWLPDCRHYWRRQSSPTSVLSFLGNVLNSTSKWHPNDIGIIDNAVMLFRHHDLASRISYSWSSNSFILEQILTQDCSSWWWNADAMQV